MSSNQASEQLEIQIRKILQKHSSSYEYDPIEGQMFPEKEIVISDTIMVGNPYSQLDDFIKELVELYEKR